MPLFFRLGLVLTLLIGGFCDEVDGQSTPLAAHWMPRPHERIFPQAGAPADTLVALDTAKLDTDTAMFVTTMQGLINRKQPRLYLYHNTDDRFWAKWLTQQKYVSAIKELPDVPAVITAFRAEIRGVIVYDPDLPASRHAAVMLGALQGYPATSRATAQRLGLPIVTDLTGRWKRNVDAYRELWTKYRDQFESHVLAVHYPAMTRQDPRDYLVQQRIFTFWVSGPKDHEPGADPAAEMAFAREVLADTPPNIPVMGWWSYGEAGLGITEYQSLELCSPYGKFLAGSEFCSNLSVLSGIQVKPEIFRQPAHREATVPTPDATKLYATLTVMDSGDSQWYWQHYQRTIWQDPARGRVPINWTLNPTVADVMPPVLAWFYGQATPKDLLFCAISGLGYMDPRVYGSAFRPEDRARIWADYTAELDRYLSQLDLDTLGLWAGAWGESRTGMDDVYDRFFRGTPHLKFILSDFGRHTATTPANAIEVVDGKLVFHTMMRWKEWVKQSSLESQLDQEQASIDFTKTEFFAHAPTNRPAWMSGLILSWTMHPTLVQKVAAQLPPDVELVDADQLAALWKQMQPAPGAK